MILVDGRNPANQLRLVLYSIIYRVLYTILGGFLAGFLPSWNCYQVHDLSIDWPLNVKTLPETNSKRTWELMVERLLSLSGQTYFSRDRLVLGIVPHRMKAGLAVLATLTKRCWWRNVVHFDLRCVCGQMGWAQHDLGGGFNNLLFASLFGEMIPFDEHIVQMGWFNHQQKWWVWRLLLGKGKTQNNLKTHGEMKRKMIEKASTDPWLEVQNVSFRACVHHPWHIVVSWWDLYTWRWSGWQLPKLPKGFEVWRII